MPRMRWLEFIFSKIAPGVSLLPPGRLAFFPRAALPGAGLDCFFGNPFFVARVSPPADSGPASDGEPAGGTESIMIVDDELQVRHLLRNILEFYGYEVIEAGHAAEALEIWRQNHHEIHLVITDVVMPGGMSGPQLAKELHAEHPQLPIIFISGYFADSVVKDLKLCEGKNFLQKPFPARKLAQAVRAMLDEPR